MSFSKEVKEELLSKINVNKIDETNFEKALIINAFLNSGSINNPNNVYHLEIIFKSEENAQNIKEYLKKVNINSNLLRKKK